MGQVPSSGSGDKSQAGPRRQDKTGNTQSLRNTQMQPRSPSSVVHLLLPLFSPWPSHPPPQFLPKTNRKGRLARKKEARKAYVGGEGTGGWEAKGAWSEGQRVNQHSTKLKGCW